MSKMIFFRIIFITQNIVRAKSLHLQCIRTRGCNWTILIRKVIYHLIELQGVFVLLAAAEEHGMGVPADIVNCPLMSLMGELYITSPFTNSSSVPPKSFGISNPTRIKSQIFTFVSSDPEAKMLGFSGDQSKVITLFSWSQNLCSLEPKFLVSHIFMLSSSPPVMRMWFLKGFTATVQTYFLSSFVVRTLCTIFFSLKSQKFITPSSPTETIISSLIHLVSSIFDLSQLKHNGSAQISFQILMSPLKSPLKRPCFFHSMANPSPIYQFNTVSGYQLPISNIVIGALSILQAKKFASSYLCLALFISHS